MIHILLVIIYLAFISLGLPDSLLGSAWPVMHMEFGVPISYAGAVSMMIAAGTIISSLLSDRLTRKLGTGRVTAIGVGCAPVYPSLIHSTPDHFGADKSQAIIGLQMASAYLGTCLMPPLFGVLANALSIGLMPFYLLALLALMLATHEQLNRR